MYWLVITSWIGYHQSTHVYPIRSPWRFVIDVILLFLYYLGFVNAGNFGVINHILFLAFISYAVWDAFRIVEYKNALTTDLWKRLVTSIIFAMAFLAISFVYTLMETKIEGVKWLFFAVIVFLLVLYRRIKWYKKQDKQAKGS